MPKDQTVEAKPILDAIEAQKSKINAKLNPEKLAEIDAVSEKIKRVVNEKGMMSVQDLNDVKNDLQETAKGAYSKAGQIFTVGKDTQTAAKGGAAQARKMLNTAASEVADANNQLAQMHGLEKNMNGNLIAPGKPEAG